MSFTNQKLLNLLKFIVLVVSLVVIFLQLKNKVVSASDLTHLYEKLGSAKAVFLLSVTFLLMLVNWSLESYKWKYLLNTVEDINFIQAVKGVLSGIAIGFATPNRVGEFVGKIAYLKSDNRAIAALMSFIGSSAQLLVTIQAGFIAIAVSKYSDTFNVFVTPLTLVFLAALSLAWFKVNLLFKWVSKFDWLKKWNQYFNQIGEVSKNKMIVVYFISLFRYMIFPLQYFVLFKMFDISIGFSECLCMTATSYILLAIVPTYAIAEIGSRGSINLLAFSALNAPFVVLSVSLLIWIINLIIPALWGSFLIVKFKLPKNV